MKIKLLKADLEIIKEAEFEIHSNKDFPHGFNVVVKFNKESPYYSHLSNGVEIHNNVTKIHVNYQSLVVKGTAFESDIHHTGCTRNSSWIESVTISEETYTHSHF